MNCKMNLLYISSGFADFSKDVREGVRNDPLFLGDRAYTLHGEGLTRASLPIRKNGT